MYKVTYYTSGSMVAFKWFNTFGEASEFSLTVKSGDVIEIKLYKGMHEGSVNN
jgi:hypothetical protein